jgi:hypothetical protein
MWFWSRMAKINWTDHVRKEEAVQRFKEERNIPQTIERRKAKWIGHILCRNSLVKYVIKGKIEGRI